MIADVAASILSRATTANTVTANSDQLQRIWAERCSARFFDCRQMPLASLFAIDSLVKMR
jgi:hypothetical protein